MNLGHLVRNMLIDFWVWIPLLYRLTFVYYTYPDFLYATSATAFTFLLPAGYLSLSVLPMMHYPLAIVRMPLTA